MKKVLARNGERMKKVERSDMTDEIQAGWASNQMDAYNAGADESRRFDSDESAKPRDAQ